MALFIAQLAFSNPTLLSAAKLGVLVASGIAAVLGLMLGLLLLKESQAAGAAECADDAERSTES
jgi:NhaA family Na+:H+ antiporter